MSQLKSSYLRTPILETERLRLRGHTLADFDNSAAMWADPKVVEFITGKPSTVAASWERLTRTVGHWELLGYGYWLIEEKLTHTFVGEVGFINAKRNLDMPLPELPEIGWVLCSEMQGKGYATEAVQAVIKWGDKHLSDERTTCLIVPTHAASIRVAEKCGYKKFADTNMDGEPVAVFDRLKTKTDQISQTNLAEQFSQKSFAD